MGANEDRKGAARTPSRRKLPLREDAAGGNVGSALRIIYDETVGEAIPGEMLDLLGKLA